MLNAHGAILIFIFFVAIGHSIIKKLELFEFVPLYFSFTPCVRLITSNSNKCDQTNAIAIIPHCFHMAARCGSFNFTFVSISFIHFSIWKFFDNSFYGHHATQSFSISLSNAGYVVFYCSCKCVSVCVVFSYK